MNKGSQSVLPYDIEMIRAAIDEGDASPDVVGFKRDAFLEELMEECIPE